MEYKNLNFYLLISAKTYLQEWLPGGVFIGYEYVVRNPLRNDKNIGSFRINYKTGLWADFATPHKGGDLISLYAYINNLSQFAAARELKITCRI